MKVLTNTQLKTLATSCLGLAVACSGQDATLLLTDNGSNSPTDNSSYSTVDSLESQMEISDYSVGSPVVTSHAMHRARSVFLHYDGVSDGAIQVTLSNASATPVEVELTVTAHGGDSPLVAAQPIVALRGKESKTLSLSDPQWVERLEKGAIGNLSLQAISHLVDDFSEESNLELFYSNDFQVMTNKEVQDIKRKIAQDPSLSSPFTTAGISAGVTVAGNAKYPLLSPKLDADALQQFQPSLDISEELRSTLGKHLPRLSESLIPGQPVGGNYRVRTKAASVGARICLNIGVEWDDDNVGEDYLTGGFWTAMGMSVWVRPEGETSFEGPYFTGPYEGQPAGCTQAISLENGSRPTIAIQSIAFLPSRNDGNMNNRVEVWVDDISSGPDGFNDQFERVTINGAGENWFNVTAANEEVRAAHAASTALQLLRPQLPGVTRLNIFTNDSTNNANTGNGTEVRIAPGGARRKYLIGHEVGHFVQFNLTGGGVATDYTETGPADCSSPPDSGALGGREWMSAAFGEGWATFYAAAAFNERSSTGGCRVGFPGMFDCEGALSFPTKHHITTCGGDVGHGNEWDWVRHFWDVYEKVSFSDLASFLQATRGVAWDRDNSYAELTAIADSHSINSAWDASSEFNGINICESGVPNGSGDVCCAASCGSCGGSGCGSRPGGSGACCVGKIRDNNKSCAGGEPPCVLDR